MSVLDFKLRQKSRGTIEVARDWLDEFGSVALATVVATWGSAPVPIGGQLVVAPGSRFEGSVSGGCVEAEVITEAEDVMASDRPNCLSSALPRRRPGEPDCPVAEPSRSTSSRFAANVTASIWRWCSPPASPERRLPC
jgi:hypothetical protein